MGFTIIEVALVLAIAGLIFLVVFLALPALQRSQRDNARKQDVARVVSAITAYRADGNPDDLGTTESSGVTPYEFGKPESANALGSYIGQLSQTDFIEIWPGWTTIFDNYGGDYSGNSNWWYGGPRYNAIAIYKGATCQGNNFMVGTGGSLKVAVAVIKLESGGYFCQNA